MRFSRHLLWGRENEVQLGAGREDDCPYLCSAVKAIVEGHRQKERRPLQVASIHDLGEPNDGIPADEREVGFALRASGSDLLLTPGLVAATQ